MSKQVYVIYHRADFDGIFCFKIAKQFFEKHYPDWPVLYIGWDYGDPAPTVPEHVVLYMLDISIDELMKHPNLSWVDHHKTAIDKYPKTIPGYRIDGVAACRLAWQYFGGINDWKGRDKPTKEDFVERRVNEPYAVRLAGEYDIWDKRDPDAELFQHGLRSCDLTNLWSGMLVYDDRPSISQIEALVDVGHQDLLRPDGTSPNPIVLQLLDYGKVVQYAKTQENAEIIKAYGFTVYWEGLCFLACNHARFNSHLFTAGIRVEHDALLGFNYNGQGKWRVSLYGIPGKDIDLSKIAVKHGGGGHKQACGFTCKTLPFLQQ